MVFPQKIEGPVPVASRKRLRYSRARSVHCPRNFAFIYLPENHQKKSSIYFANADDYLQTAAVKQINKEKMND
jgi:hypothetical protein